MGNIYKREMEKTVIVTGFVVFVNRQYRMDIKNTIIMPTELKTGYLDICGEIFFK